MKAKWNRHGIVRKSSSQNNIFVNPPPLPLLCEFLKPYTWCNQVLQQAGWQADEIQVNFENFKVGCRSKYWTCHFD